MLAVCIALLLAGTLPPLLNLGRYQQRIAGAISRSIGRPVSVESIRLQLLPWPAFQLTNLTVGEDPGFGAEPALRAPEVVLEPSLTSLWRGRFEISKVEISNASVNLVRNADRRWNISSVLLQASHVRNSPTGETHAGQPPRFPYIEATGTRINIKRGLEKLPYSLLNADFSMWLANPDTWEIRLQGQPARTDLAATSGDTGDIRLEGRIHRASELGGMPVSLTGAWTDAPLGQAGRLLLGREVGWRGRVNLHAQFIGQIDALAVRAHLEIANLHRQEFTPEEPFGVDATCTGHYSRLTPDADAFHCRWPVGDGALLLSSNAATAESPRSFALAVDHVAAGFPMRALDLLRGNLPSADLFHGTLQGSLSYDLATGGLRGSVQMPALQIDKAAADGGQLSLAHVQIAAIADAPTVLQVTSDPVALGVGADPMTAAAALTPHGYTLTADGGLTPAALHAAASALQLPRLRQITAAPHGAASIQLALTTTGPWLNSSGGDTPARRYTGTLHLENVQWQAGWLPAVQMSQANAILSPESIRWNVPKAILRTGAGTGSPLLFAVNAEQPLLCTQGASCPLEFSLSTASLSTAELQAVFGSRQNALLSAVLARFDPTHFHLPALRGSIHAGVFTLGRLPIRNAAALIATGPGEGGAQRLRIETLDGRALGGALHLMGSIAALGSTPVYAVQATLSGASATKTAALWHENWGPGSLGGSADFTASGSNADDLLQSATGKFQAAWQGGTLGKVLPRFASWDAVGRITSDGLELTRSTLAGTAATLTGTIGWDHSLHLRLVRAPGAAAEAIAGTLAKPDAKVTPKPAE